MLDSSVLIAYHNERDEKHARAVEIMKQANEGVFGTLFTCDYVFDETINYAARKTGDKRKALLVGEWLLGTQITLLYTRHDRFKSAWELFKKTSGLSFTDCIIVTTCLSEGITHLATFDSGFHQVKGIRLIE